MNEKEITATMRAAGKIAACLMINAALGWGCARDPRGDDVKSGDRVVSLAPSVTEIIWAVGAGSNQVGRTSACDYPPEAVKVVPVIGGFGKPNIDSLLSVNPTLVLEVDLEDENLGRLMDKLGIRRKRIRCSELDDIPRAILEVGRLVGREEKAEYLAGVIRQKVAELRSEARAREARSEVPSVYVEIWGDPLMTVGRGSFISELVSLAGGRNIGDEVEVNYFSVSPEWIIVRDPEIIICLYMSDACTIRDIVRKRAGWGGIKAVREGRIYGGLDSNLMLRPGPRVLEGIESLRGCMK